MDSGDLGYRADGELFITGRQKDVIIKAGRNLYPQEVEELVGELRGIRTGCVAAFGVADPRTGTEQLVVVAESRETTPERLETLRAAVADTVVTALGVPPDTVVLARPGAVLKTSSGKIRRSATRDVYLRGEIQRGRASARAQWARLVLSDVGARASRVATGTVVLAYAGYVGVLLALTLPVLWALLLVLPGGRTADGVVRFWCRSMLRLCGCPVRVDGVEHLRTAGPAILAVNHSSYLDAVVLLAVLPVEFVFVAKRELIGSPVVGTAIRKAGHLTVERRDPGQSAADAERATARLRAGVSLLFFPEGTFLRGPGLLPFRLGAFKASVETGRPVVPIGLRGTREILPAHAWRPRRGSITLTVGPPLAPKAAGWPEMVRLRDLTRAEIERLTREDREGA
jgi:1-acyl-sn-glycerol-3-phosphate acyltransferase